MAKFRIDRTRLPPRPGNCRSTERKEDSRNAKDKCLVLAQPDQLRNGGNQSDEYRTRTKGDERSREDTADKSGRVCQKHRDRHPEAAFA